MDIESDRKTKLNTSVEKNMNKNENELEKNNI